MMRTRIEHVAVVALGPAIRTVSVLVAVGSIIAIVATTVLFALSTAEISRSPAELVVPLVTVTGATVLTLALGGSPYWAGRGKTPAPLLWLASIAYTLVVAGIVVSIATGSGVRDGTGGIIALTLMVPVCVYTALALVIIELLLRKKLD